MIAMNECVDVVDPGEGVAAQISLTVGDRAPTFPRSGRWEIMRIGSIHGIMVVALALSLASPARGQFTGEGRALEFRTDQPWGRLSLDGQGGARGPSPLRVSGPLQGDFWLAAGGAGVETQRGQVRVALDERGSRIASYGSTSRNLALRRSILFPGLHQLRNRDRRKGLLMATAGAASTGLVIWSQYKYRAAEDDTDLARRAFGASGILEERIEFQRELADRRHDENRAVDRRNLMLMTAGAAWGVSALDALFFSPGFEVRQADANSLTLGMQPKTRVNVVLRSIVFPGLAQSYNGQGTKAGWLGLGGIAVVGYVLRQQDEYLGAVSEFDKAQSRFDSASTVVEQEEFAQEAQARFEESEDRYRERNTALIVAASYWGVSLLDAMLSFGEAWGSSRTAGSTLGWSADPVQGTLAANVTF